MEDPDSALQPGYTLDRYELLCQLASGGMATVWLARMQGKRGFEKLLAVKTIKSELSGDARFEEMFLDEARIASGIHHPNVAQIIDLGEKDDVLYLVMEWVDGESLAQIRRVSGKNGAKVPLGVALRIVADSCAGLHAAHELRDAAGKNLGVVHRDVSPQNILVSTAGSVKIIDFGVAKAANRLAPETRTGILKGKLQYMAPEQALDHPVDRRADLWALGVCLYELIADRMPFDGDNQLSMLNKICSGEPPPPLGDDVPPSVAQIVMTSLARDPDARFPTAAAMRRAVEAAIVELALPSSSEDVVAFVDANLPERAVRREEIISRALKKAALRAEEANKVQTGTVRVALGEKPDGAALDSVLVRPSEMATRVEKDRGSEAEPFELNTADSESSPPGTNSAMMAPLSAATKRAIGATAGSVPPPSALRRHATWLLPSLAVAAVIALAVPWGTKAEAPHVNAAPAPAPTPLPAPARPTPAVTAAMEEVKTPVAVTAPSASAAASAMASASAASIERRGMPGSTGMAAPTTALTAVTPLPVFMKSDAAPEILGKPNQDQDEQANPY